MADGAQFKTIVAPIDFAEVAEDDEDVAGFSVDANDHRVAFSEATVKAVQLAMSLARDSGATLHLLHAVPPMNSSAMYQGPVSVPSQIIDEIHDRARKTSVQAMTALVDAQAAKVDVQLVVGPGKAMSYVLEQARVLSADLIVMAASGRSRVARFFVGSTADRVIREATCPVMVVPADQHD